ncbi:Farnesyl pyrophosphate synthase [Araneus ventricosus]|uniref:Farnesyl pyrophosphate synthase n=1 Tax=Araneus ventricosus TaxID=182803 RepID=A0A4Y2JDP2_ARAVE|nr:Farnesyl pyrophosphate synthase [Araneus ventricosus]
MNLLHQFFQVDHISIHGQCLDMMFNPKNQKPRFDMFTFEKYQALTEYKTAHYSFCLPVHLAMHLAGEYSAIEFDFTRELCLKLGLYYGIQNDYLDCFGKPEVTGKIGNDIAEGKCTWCSVKFLEAASEPMKKEFFVVTCSGKIQLSQILALEESAFKMALVLKDINIKVWLSPENHKLAPSAGTGNVYQHAGLAGTIGKPMPVRQYS